MKENAEI